MKESRIHEGSNIQWIAKIFHAKRQAMTIVLKRVLNALFTFCCDDLLSVRVADIL